MAGVPYVFGNATTSIPLTNLDANFNTGLTIGNTTVGLGNTVTTLGNVTLTNVNIVSGTVPTANSIVNGTSNVVIVSSGGAVNIATNGTQAITVDTSQNVGIGTASPTTKLDVTGNLKVTNSSGSTIVANRTANPGSIEIQYGGTQTAQFSAISGGGLEIYTGSSPALRMSVNAYGIGLGTAVPSSGIGITFPATQSASSDANTLDDYEEGTWTPVLVPSAGSLTTQSSGGVYTKIGNTVYCSGIILITNAGTASGSGQINGLPFTSTAAYNSIGSTLNSFTLREDGVTGLLYQGSVRTSVTYCSAWSITNGPLIYGGSYTYVFSFFYKIA